MLQKPVQEIRGPHKRHASHVSGHPQTHEPQKLLHIRPPAALQLAVAAIIQHAYIATCIDKAPFFMQTGKRDTRILLGLTFLTSM